MPRASACSRELHWIAIPERWNSGRDRLRTCEGAEEKDSAIRASALGRVEKFPRHGAIRYGSILLGTSARRAREQSLLEWRFAHASLRDEKLRSSETATGWIDSGSRSSAVPGPSERGNRLQSTGN